MVHDVINNLVRDLDRQTAWALQMTKEEWPHFAVMGDDSPFIKAVKKKAEQFGLEYSVYPNSSLSYFYTTPLVYDRETCRPNILGKDADVDNVQHDGMSCVAEAVYLLLKRMDLISGKDITIVGRGHAVKGLAERLIAGDATVTVAHSKTKTIYEATEFKDVVVYATPNVTGFVDCDTRQLVIDLGGCIKDPGMFECEYTRDIGKLTVSVLVSRLVCGGCPNLTEMHKEVIRQMCACNLNMTKAAEKMHYHRNTLVYYIKCIEKETGLDVRKFCDAFKLLKMINHGHILDS